jgi:chaperonin GroES
MSKTLTPFNDRVIIKPIEEDEQMYGNIVIPDLGKERPEMGQVIATGPGRQTEFGQFIRVNAKVGDIVLIPKIGSIRIDFEGT